MISQSENIIMLATPYQLQDFCGMFPVLPDSEGNLPMGKDACVPAPPIPCEPPAPFIGLCPSQPYPAYFIWPLTDTIAVTLVQNDAAFSQESASAFALANNGVNLPPRPRQGLQLSLKGVTNG